MPRGISNGLYLVRYACMVDSEHRIREQYVTASTVRDAVDQLDLDANGYVLVEVFRRVDYR